MRAGSSSLWSPGFVMLYCSVILTPRLHKQTSSSQENDPVWLFSCRQHLVQSQPYGKWPLSACDMNWWKQFTLLVNNLPGQNVHAWGCHWNLQRWKSSCHPQCPLCTHSVSRKPRLTGYWEVKQMDPNLQEPWNIFPLAQAGTLMVLFSASLWGSTDYFSFWWGQTSVFSLRLEITPHIWSLRRWEGWCGQQQGNKAISVWFSWSNLRREGPSHLGREWSHLGGAWHLSSSVALPWLALPCPALSVPLSSIRIGQALLCSSPKQLSPNCKARTSEQRQ